MAVTIQQIADRAGVSRGTVDRALNMCYHKENAKSYIIRM